MSYLTPQDIEIYSGDTLHLLVTIIDGDTNLPKNLSGLVSARWEVSKSAKVASTISKTLGMGIMVLNALAGEIRIDVLPSDTATLKGDFIHELEIIDFAGEVNTVMDGKFTILIDVVN
jgi:hypothetical protein